MLAYGWGLTGPAIRSFEGVPEESLCLLRGGGLYRKVRCNVAELDTVDKPSFSFSFLCIEVFPLPFLHVFNTNVGIPISEICRHFTIMRSKESMLIKNIVVLNEIFPVVLKLMESNEEHNQCIACLNESNVTWCMTLIYLVI